MARLGRLVLVALTTVAVIAGVVVGGLWLLSRSGVADEFVRGQVLGLLARSLPGAEVTIARTGGLLGRRLVLYDVEVRVGGRRIAHVPRTEILYRPLALLRSVVRLDRVTVEAPSLRAIREPGGWRLPRLVQGGGGTGMTVELRRVEVRGGRLAVALLDASPPRRLGATALAAEASATIDASGNTLHLRYLRGVPRGVAVTPFELAAHLAEARGTLAVDEVRVATAHTRLTGDGRLVPGRSVDARLALAPLAARETRALVPASRLLADVRGTLRVAGPWRAVGIELETDLGAAGATRASGTLDLVSTPPAYRALVDFSGLDPGAAVDGLVRARASGRVRAAGRGLGRTAAVSYHVALAPSEIDGRPLTRLVVSGHGRDGVHDLGARVAAPVGDASLRARVALADPVDYRLASRLRLRRIEDLWPPLPGWANGRVAARGRGFAPESRRAVARASLSGASLRGVPLTHGVVEASLAGERLDLAVARLAGPSFHAEARGTADLARRSLDAGIDVGGDLAAVEPRLTGTVSVQASARGLFDALAVEVSALAEHPAFATAQADQARAHLTVAGLGGAAPSGSLRLDAQQARLGDAAPRALRAEVDWRRSGGVDRATVAASATNAEAPVDRVAITFERGPATFRGELRELALTPPGEATWELTRPARFTLADGVETPGLTLAAGQQVATLTGRIARQGTNQATLTLTRLALAPLCRLAGPLGCTGELSGRATLGGTPSAPRLDATLAVAEVRVDEVSYGRVDATLGYAEAKAALHGVLAHPTAGALRVDGSVPVDLAWSGPRRDLSLAPIALEAQADGLDLTALRSLAPHTLRSTAGRLGLRVRVTGVRAAPHVEGQLTLDGGHLELVAAGLAYEDIRLRATADGARITVTEMHARAGDGTFEGGGTIDLAGAQPIAVTARLQDFFAVRRPAFEGTVNGTVAIGGTLRAPEVRAKLDLVHALLRPAALPASGPSLEPDETIRVIGGPAAPAPPAEGAAVPLADRLSLVADVHIARDAWIRRADANIELAGDLHIEKPPYEALRVSGQIRLIRGWYNFQGRRFTLQRGSTITFTGATPPKPTLDVTAFHDVASYHIEVRIAGPIDKPTLSFTSEPPMEQADILAVLLFGRPTDQLGRGQSAGLQRHAVQLAAGYVMPELRESVMSTLGLDTLSVELPEGEEAPGRVSVGRYVTGDIFVSLAQEFGVRAGEVVSLEYALTPRISVRASTSTRGDSAIDAFWQRRY